MLKKIISKYRVNITVIILLILFSLLFPTVVTMANMKKSQMKLYTPEPYGKYVIMSGNGENTRIDVESFVPLVLYSVMPEKYSEETMKSMAVVIRTYIIYKINEQNTGDSIRDEKLGLPYTTYSELEKKWGKKYETKYNNTMKLIEETNREVIYFAGEPVYPYYHEISAGMTNSGEYDYLMSVDSKQDIDSPDYMKVLYFTPDNIIEKLQTRVSVDLTPENLSEAITINVKENSEYVDSISVGDEEISVQDWQNIFEIPSQAFTFEPFSDGYKIVSKGSGCGKGLSIYGAEKMAEEGKNYKEILNYYYTNVDIHD